MKLSNLFMIALLAGTLGVFGCSDDNGGTAGSGGSGTAGTGGSGTAGTGGSGTAGTGGSGTAGTGGSGGIVDSATACGGADCQGDNVLKAACEREYNLCLEVNPTPEECLAGAELLCGNI